MKNELIKINLPSDIPGEASHECCMSVDLYENARMTMGELRDTMRQLGISWEFIRQQIEIANSHSSPVDKALDSMDEYSTGPGKSLRDLPSNIF